MHPSYEVDREYAVRVHGEVDEAMLERLKEGVLLEDGMAKFTDIHESGGEARNRLVSCCFDGREKIAKCADWWGVHKACKSID